MHYSLLVLLPKPPEDEQHLHEMLNELLLPFNEELEVETDEDGNPFNPEGKWDWWELGGRWLGLFDVADATEVAYYGEPGTFGNGPAHPNGCDVAVRRVIRNDPLDQIHAVLAEGVWKDSHPVADWNTHELGNPIDWEGAEQRFQAWLAHFWQSIPSDQWLALIDYHT